MLIRVSDILTIDELARGKYIGDSEALSRPVDMLIPVWEGVFPKDTEYGDVLFVTSGAGDVTKDISAMGRGSCSLIILCGYRGDEEALEACVRGKDFGIVLLKGVNGEKRLVKRLNSLLYKTNRAEELGEQLVASILFNNELYSGYDYVYLSKVLGYEVKGNYRVFILKIIKGSSALYKEIRQELSTRLGIELVILWRECIVAVVPEKIGDSSAFDLIKTYYVEELQERRGISCKIAFGEPYEGLENARESLAEALRTFDLIDMLDRQVSIISYRQLGLFRVLYEMSDSRVFKSFFQDMFSPLWDYDRDKQTTLFKTLEVYMGCNCDMDKASEALFIHKNTLRYRLSRIEEILELDLHNINDLMEISAAFKIRRLSSILED